MRFPGHSCPAPYMGDVPSPDPPAIHCSATAISGEHSGTTLLPPLLAPDPAAPRRVTEFFTADIRNPNTRKAYARAAGGFAAWCERHGIAHLRDVEPVHVAAYVEELGGRMAPPSVKLHLAGIRILFDWLVLGQVIPTNPANAVRGPKHYKLQDYATARPSSLPPHPKAWLFPTALGSSGRLSNNPMAQADVYRMMRAAAGIETQIGCHSFRATGLYDCRNVRGEMQPLLALDA